jgi:hypothetical protein
LKLARLAHRKSGLDLGRKPFVLKAHDGIRGAQYLPEQKPEFRRLMWRMGMRFWDMFYLLCNLIWQLVNEYIHLEDQIVFSPMSN